MKRSTFDETKENQEVQTERWMSCKWCGTSTLSATLNQYGARCFRCYEAYLNAQQEVPAWMADKRTEGPKAWAEALRRHDRVGSRVSKVQREMYRSAFSPVLKEMAL